MGVKRNRAATRGRWARVERRLASCVEAHAVPEGDGCALEQVVTPEADAFAALAPPESVGPEVELARLHGVLGL